MDGSSAEQVNLLPMDGVKFCMGNVRPFGVGLIGPLGFPIPASYPKPEGKTAPETEGGRVSSRRQGVIATKVRASVDRTGGAPGGNTRSGEAAAAACLSAWFGCQYSGVAQFWTGTSTRPRAVWAVSAADIRTRAETTRTSQVDFILSFLLCLKPEFPFGPPVRLGPGLSFRTSFGDTRHQSVA